MTCPSAGSRPLCTTCQLGGLIRCPILGTPLPLVEGERPKVETRKAWPPVSPNGMSEMDLEAFRKAWQGRPK